MPKQKRRSKDQPEIQSTAPIRVPPQRAPVPRSMSASMRIGIGPSQQVDCSKCDEVCGRLPHQWRQTCLAECRSACAAGPQAMAQFTASLGQRSWA